MRRLLITLAWIGTFATQADAQTTQSAPAAAQSFALPIERAHHAELWRSRRAFEAQLEVEFGGQKALEGRLIFEIPGGRSRLELQDGTVAVWDGKAAWVAPAASKLGARFHLLTWPYFIEAPMKLRDPGTRLEELGARPLQGSSYPAARLSFAPGTGDTPEDWYVVYRDPATDRLHALAYIVTYGKSAEQANQEPHAMSYSGYAEVEGIPMATELTAWAWSEAEGIHGQPIGHVRLRQARFVTPAPEAFAVPEGAREDKLPEN